MKIVLTTTTAFALLAGVTFAQDTAAPAPSPTPSAGGMPSQPLPPPPGLTQEKENAQPAAKPSRSNRGGRGAYFRVDTGKVKLSLRCGDDESTSECAETLTRLMDRLKVESNEGDRTNQDDRSARLMHDRDMDRDRGNRFRHRDRDHDFHWDDDDERRSSRAWRN
jgi:hypothetical protein